MHLFALTNRELATAILAAAFVVLCLVVPSIRRAIASSVVGVLRAFFVWKIQLPLIFFYVYLAGIVLLAHHLGLWQAAELKDTVILAVFTGMPLFFSANTMKDEVRFARKIVRDTVGVSAIVLFYINLATLPLLGEIFLQLVATCLVLIPAVAGQKAERQSAATAANLILALIGVGLLIYTTVRVVDTWTTDTALDDLASLLLSIWIPLAVLPFIYVLAFFSWCESVLPTAASSGKQRSSLAIQLATIRGLHLRTYLASELNGGWRAKLGTCRSASDATRLMSSFRRAVRDRDEALAAYDQHLLAMTDKQGVDVDGLQLDRREFASTKGALTSLWYDQLGWSRNKHLYNPQALEYIATSLKGLPDEHGIQLIVRHDGKAWRAWRQVPNGWWFGIGGTSNEASEWRYDGPEAPTGFPSSKSGRWVDATIQESSAEWQKDDEPPTFVRQPIDWR